MFNVGPFKGGVFRLTDWLQHFVFLIPFELVGLIFAGLFLLELLEPFRVTRWVFQSDQILTSTNRLGLPLGLRRQYEIDEVLHLAVRTGVKTDTKKRRSLMSNDRPPGYEFELVVTDSANQHICPMTGLTLGEARWIKGRIQADSRLISSRQ